MDARGIIRRNSVFMVLEGALFYAALSFIPNETVIAEFIDYTSGSVTLAGLAATMSSLMFYVGEFICGLFIHKVKKQLPFMTRMGFLSRGLLMVFALVMLSGFSGKAAAWLFIAAYGVIFTIDGFVGLCWNQVLARTMPLEKRGEVLSLQQSLCGGIGVLAGFILQRIMLSGMEQMAKFRLIFFISAVILIISAVMMVFFKDVKHPSHPELPVKNPVRYAGELLPMLTDNRGVRQVIIGRVLFTLTLISAPINYKFGMVSGLSEFQLSVLLYMPFAGQILAGIFWSRVSRRTNYPTMMLLAQASGIVCALLNITAFAVGAMGYSVMIPLSAAMLLLKFTNVANNAFTQHVIAIVDEEKRANAIVLTSLITAPATFGTTLAGAIADWAFWPVYVIMLASGTAGLLQTYHFFVSKKSPLPPEQRGRINEPA